MRFIKPSCDINFVGADCSGVEDQKTCKRNKAIEQALKTLRDDYEKDRMTCKLHLPKYNIMCVKRKLKEQIELYIIQHPGLIGDFESLKGEIRNEFPAVKAAVLNKLLNALADEIKKGDGSEEIDAGKVADLVSQAAALISNSNA